MERLQKIGNQINGDVSKLSTLAIAEQIKVLYIEDKLTVKTDGRMDK